MLSYQLADQQWFADAFWLTVDSIVKYAKSQTEVDEERLIQAVLKDWLALAVPLGRA